MSEETVQQDTPQEEASQTGPANTPQDAFSDNQEDSGTPFSFEDVIYGPDGERKEAQAPPRSPEQVTRDIENQEAGQTQQVDQSPAPTQQEYQAKNDEKRFEYWQSQASKMESRLKELEQRQRPLQTYAQENPAAFQQVQQEPRYTSQGPTQPAQQESDDFPPPPERPDKPRNFNREAAYTDSTSESAAYLDDLEEWRDNMDEYSGLKQEYESARVEEYIQAQQVEKNKLVKQQQAYAHQQKQIGEIHEYVQANYGLTSADAQQFIAEYSDPKSVTMDNLVQLYRMNHGGQVVQQPIASNAPINMDAQPSSTFQQTQRAQQVPQPMGVQSGIGNSNPNDGKPAGQGFMESLIGKHNKNDAF
jgi:hypothetical protein